MSARLRGNRAIGLLVSVLGLTTTAARGQGPSPSPPSPRARIAIVGVGDESTRVRDVTAELLARDGIAVTWAAQTAFQPRDIFERGTEDGVAVWVDLSAPAEARLYFRDARAARFFIRSLALAQGIDEIAREEIAHIVSNAVLALGHGGGDALTRSEARQALHMEAQETAPQLANPSRPLRWVAAALAGAEMSARELPIAPRATVSLELARGPRWGRAGGAFGGWLDLGYQFAVNYRGTTVGAEVQTTSLRAGGLWETESRRGLVLRFALGAGADRIHYQPRDSAATVDLAPAGTFYVPVASACAGLDVRLVDALAFTARVGADATLARVHFDLHNGSVGTSRVLVQYPVRPTAALGMAWLF